MSANFFGIGASGSAQFFPPQICITLPLSGFPGAGEIGIGDIEFCVPPDIF